MSTLIFTFDHIEQMIAKRMPTLLPAIIEKALSRPARAYMPTMEYPANGFYAEKLKEQIKLLTNLLPEGVDKDSLNIKDYTSWVLMAENLRAFHCELKALGVYLNHSLKQKSSIHQTQQETKDKVDAQLAKLMELELSLENDYRDFIDELTWKFDSFDCLYEIGGLICHFFRAEYRHIQLNKEQLTFLTDAYAASNLTIPFRTPDRRN